MSKKRRRKRPEPLRPPEAEVASDRRGTAGSGRAREAGRRTATTGGRTTGQRDRGRASTRPGERRRPRTPEERRAAAEQWAHPPLGPSVAKGLRAVGSSPVLVVSAFLATLALWLIFTAYGAAPAPSAMVLLTALPPAHSLLDIEAVLTGGSSAPGATLLFLAGLLAFRAALISLWVAGSLERLTGTEPLHRATSAVARRVGADELSAVLRRALRSFAAVLGVEAGFYVISMAIALAALQSAALQLAVIAALVGGLLFFVFAPIVAVVEEVGLGPAIRISIKAARLPGPRHMLATVAYIGMTLTVSLLAPTSRVAAATPTITVWLFVLLVTFLHVSALATFVYRWLVVRDRVIGGPAAQADGQRDRVAPAALR